MTTKVKLTDDQINLANKLTTLQRRFVINLVGSDMSQRQAYIAAGGTAKTEQAQDAAASRMLSDVKVKTFYDSLMESAQVDAVMTKAEALERLSKSARATIHDVCDFKLVEVGKDDDGDPIMQTVWTIKHSDEIDPIVAASIKSVTFTKSGPKIEMYDSNGSIKILSDLQGWNAPKKSELTGKDGAPIQLTADVSSPEIANALTGLMEML